MSIVTERPDTSQTASAERPHWLVELNIAGCRISRWAEKRRHLLGLDLRSLTS